MSNKSCRQDVKARARQQLQALPMSRPENKPDLDTEEADRPKAGDGTKTAILNMIKDATAADVVRAGRQAAKGRVSGGREALEMISAAKDGGKPLSGFLVNKLRDVMRPRDFKALESAGFDPGRASQLVQRNIGLNEKRVSQSFAQRLGPGGEELGRGASRSAASQAANRGVETVQRGRVNVVTPSSITPVNVSSPLSNARTQKSVPASGVASETRVVSTPQGPGSTMSSSTQTAAPAPRRAPPAPGVAPVFENRPPTAVVPAATQNARRSVNPAPAEAAALPRRAPTGEASVAPVFSDRPPTSIGGYSRAETGTQTAAFVPRSQQQAPSVAAQPQAPSVAAQPQAPAQVAAPVQAPMSPSAQAGQAAGMQMATQTRPGGMLAASTAGANPTMNMAAVGVPQSMSPARAQQLIAADPGYSATAARQAQAAQAAAQAPAQVAQRPMTAGRMALVAGSTGLAGAMMNRAPQQQQQQQVY